MTDVKDIKKELDNPDELEELEQKLKAKEQELEELEQKLEKRSKILEDNKEKLEQQVKYLEMENNKKLQDALIKQGQENSEKFRISFNEFIEEHSKKIKDLLSEKVELAKREADIEQKYADIEIEKEKLNARETNFDNDLEAKLKLKTIEHKNTLANERHKMLEDVKKEIQELHLNKENELKSKENELKDFEAKLKEKEFEIERKNKELENNKNTFEQNLEEKYKCRIDSLEETKNYQADLIEERDEEIKILKEQISRYEQNSNLEIELDATRHKDEIRLLKGEIERIRKELDTSKSNADKEMEIYKDRIDSLELSNKELLLENNKLYEIKNKNEQLKTENKEIEYYKEKADLWKSRHDDLQKIYTMSDALEVRVQCIKKEMYEEKSLGEKNDIEVEIDWLNNIQKHMDEYGVKYPKRLLHAFHTALKSSELSPITVLSGVSGTGKSELPKLYAYFGGFNFLAESVQPNWDSPESMIGYYNTVENRFDSTSILKFLMQTTQTTKENEFGWRESMNMILLDEMNLAHIELYFAEFLSKFEQRRGSSDIKLDIKLGAGMIHRVPLLRNILWVGTMNEDETTKALSDKVLDRSFCVNFPRPNKLQSRDKIKMLRDICEFKFLPTATWEKWLEVEISNNEIFENSIKNYNDITNKINMAMSKVGKAIGHRVWQSMQFYIKNHIDVLDSIKLDDEEKIKTSIRKAYEEQLVQKIMPKLRGVELGGDEGKVLDEIKELLTSNNLELQEDFDLARKNPYGQFIWNSAEYLKDGE
ncbi:hypothetical protein [Campylobacter devanensis]|uniref:hypothetical protein n=1 Tax=Campylobacter devanensis TaxID=3161138 RepID=UPI000A34D576|nr:hypothetical protein [Campylobacter sp. P160]